ncbi:MAG: hypothetical protein NT051_00915 [Candidatus Micrarchaeota archaeon]|nr:hypothetical protein [Candidatus Micrarchaeota archaeon]
MTDNKLLPKGYFDHQENLQPYVWELLKFSLGVPMLKKYKGKNLAEKLYGFKESEHIHDKAFGERFAEHLLSLGWEYAPKPDSLYEHYLHKALSNSGKGARFYQILVDSGVAGKAELKFEDWSSLICSRLGKKAAAGQKDAPAASESKKGYVTPRNSEAVALDIPGIELYAGQFKLLMANYLGIKQNFESFDVHPASKLAEAFADRNLSEFLRNAENSKNLPRGSKISNLYILCQKALNELKSKGKISSTRGRVMPSMIKTLGWNPETGRLISEETAEAKATGVKRAGLPTPESVLYDSIVDIAKYSFEKFMQGEIGAIDCRSLSPDRILHAFSATNAGVNLAVVIPDAPDLIFREALGRMGYSVQLEMLNASIPNDGNASVLFMNRSQVINGVADKIEFHNGLTPASALCDSIMAEVNKAKTQADVEELLKTTESLIAHLKSQEKGAYLKQSELHAIEERLFSRISEAHDLKEKGCISEGFDRKNLDIAKGKILAAMRKGVERVLAHKDNRALFPNASKR